MNETEIELAASAATVAYNVAVNRVFHESSHIPANLTAAGLITYAARRSDVGWDQLGLSTDEIKSGLRWGSLSVLPIAAVIGAALAHPKSRRLFLDEKISGTGRHRFAYEVLFRIPLATAIPEEVIFRGALYGIFAKKHSPVVAATLSSLIFGLWHVLPTHQSIETRAAGASVREHTHRRLGTIAGAVAATTAAGYALCWLRLKSQSLVAPILAHGAANSIAFIAGRVVGRIERARSA